MNNRKISKTAYFLDLIILALVPLYRASFGVDFTDTGYSISNFLNFADRRGFWSLSTYLANFVGFIFSKLPYGNTLIGIRVYCTLITSALVVLLFVKLTRYFDTLPVFVGLLISVFMTWCPFVVLYNYLSYLLTAVAIILLLEGYDKAKERNFLIAGILLGANVFVRFSNLTAAILIVPVVVCGIKEGKRLYRRIGLCVGGFGIGVFSVYIMTGVTHGFSALFKMLGTLSSLSNADYGYSYTDMLMTLPNEIVRFGKWILLLALVTMVSVIVTAFSKKYNWNIWINVMTSVVTAGLVFVILRYMSYWSAFTFHDYSSYLSVEVFVLLLVLGVFAVAVVSLCKKENIFISVTILCLVFIIPLGTNTGNLAYQNFLFVILPMGLGVLWKLIGKEKESDLVKPVNVVVFLLLFVSVFQSAMFYKTFCYASAPNHELTASIDDGVLRKTKVLPGMVDIIGGADTYIEAAGYRGRQVITWGDIPLMGFAFKMPSAISTGWPDLTSYPAECFKNELSGISQKYDETGNTDLALPIVITNNWFSGGNPLNEEVWQYSDKAKLLADFMSLYNYEPEFTNDKFTVYAPHNK